MSVSNIFSSSSAGALTNSLVAALSPPTAASVSGQSGAASTSFSQTSQLVSQLQQLATSNPTEFKQVTSAISSQLSQAAQQTSGNASTFLTNLANQFQTASQSGSTASITLGKQSGGHHGHGHGGGGGGSTAALLAAASQTTSSTTSASAVASSTYSSQSQNPLSALDSIIENALSSAGSAAALPAAG